MKTLNRKRKQIISIKVKRIEDESPDLSHLGDFSDGCDHALAIVHASGDYQRTFVADLPEDVMIERDGGYFIPENCDDASLELAEQRKYAMENYKRVVTYGQRWCMVGIRATAEVVINSTIQWINSGGIWGVETDSEDSYFKEVGDGELNQLCADLKEIGFSDGQIRKAKKEARRDET